MRLIHRFISANPLFASAGVVLVGSLTAHVLNYVFHLVMGRMLSPSEYGSVAAVVTLSMLTAAPSQAVSLLLGSEIPSRGARQGDDAAYTLYARAFSFSLRTGIAAGAVFAALAPLLAGFFKTETLPFVLFGILTAVSLASSANSGALQGLSQFGSLSVMQILPAAAKLLFSVVLVLLGFSVSGVVLAMILGAAASLFFSRRAIQRHFSASRHSPILGTLSWRSAVRRAAALCGPTFLATIMISLFHNLDVVFAKHVLEPDAAGEYSALAVLGRIITYGSLAAVTVLLPSASASHASGDGKARKHLFAALALTTLCSAAGSAVFFLFPETVVRLLFGAKYAGIASHLGLFGFAMALGSVAMVFVHYSLAIKSTAFLLPFGIAVVILAAGIAWFGDTILSMVKVQLVAHSVFLLGMIGVSRVRRP